MAARVAPQGLPALADDEGADLAERQVSTPIDYQDIVYYSAPKKKKRAQQPRRGRSRDHADLREARHPARGAEAAGRRRGRRGVRQRLGGDDVQGQAGREWASSSAPSPRRCASIPSWCRSTSARWCRYTDNFFAALNSAVFTDGSFVYIPKGVRCPMELSTYFRINAKDTGQFERTLIIADEGAYRQLPRRLHRADARREPAARRGRRAGGATTARRSSTRRCRTGTRATRTARAASTTS